MTTEGLGLARGERELKAEIRAAQRLLLEAHFRRGLTDLIRLFVVQIPCLSSIVRTSTWHIWVF